jgi:hypothetical protein
MDTDEGRELPIHRFELRELLLLKHEDHKDHEGTANGFGTTDEHRWTPITATAAYG